MNNVLEEVAIPACVPSSDHVDGAQQIDDAELSFTSPLAFSTNILCNIMGEEQNVIRMILDSLLYLLVSRRIGLKPLIFLYIYQVHREMTYQKIGPIRIMLLVIACFPRKAFFVSILRRLYNGGGNFLVGIELNPGPPKPMVVNAKITTNSGKDKHPNQGGKKLTRKRRAGNEAVLIDQIVKITSGPTTTTTTTPKVSSVPVGDCRFFVETGTCKFGANCKFKHPAVVVLESEEIPEVVVTAKDTLKALNEQDDLESYYRFIEKIKEVFP